MPAPKDPAAYERWKKNISKAAKAAGVGRWMKGRKPSKATLDKRKKSLKKTFSSPEMRKKMSKVAKKAGNGKWMKGRKAPAVSKSNKWRKGKTYKELYGDRAKKEKKKRRDSNRKRWEGVEKKQRNRHNGEARYKRWRNRVYKRDNWTCQKCGVRGGLLNAHHIKSWSKYPDLRYTTSNGITYCETCHEIHHYGKKRKRK